MIETSRLQLIPCELSHFEAIVNDETSLAALLQVELAEDWLGFAAAREAMLITPGLARRKFFWF
jgi:hypothetical protein